MDHLPGFDDWLEAPYQRAQEAGERLTEAWEQHCEEEDIDPSDDEAYQEWLKEYHGD